MLTPPPVRVTMTFDGGAKRCKTSSPLFSVPFLLVSTKTYQPQSQSALAVAKLQPLVPVGLADHHVTSAFNRFGAGEIQGGLKTIYSSHNSPAFNQRSEARCSQSGQDRQDGNYNHQFDRREAEWLWPPSSWSHKLLPALRVWRDCMI